tara:strand:- start:1735 stop:2037 length:303 start_codon:yes stop_codon:yes gene_type:complete
MAIVDYTSGDISIKKVENGWLLIESHHDHPERLMYTVYESDLDSHLDIQVDDAHSLMRLVGDAFEAYCRSKYSGGIVLEFDKKGWAYEEEKLDQEGDEKK